MGAPAAPCLDLRLVEPAAIGAAALALSARPATGSRLRAAPQQLGVCPLEGRVALAVEQVRVVAVVRVPEAARVIREEHVEGALFVGTAIPTGAP